MPAATKFIDIAFVPFQMRAMLGDDLAQLAAEAPRAINDAVELLASGGWLNDWH